MSVPGGHEQLRVGLAGLGRFGKLHAAVLGALPGVALVAVCDPEPEELAAMAARYPDADAYDDYQTLLTSTPLDALFIVSPEPLHAEQAIAALRHGTPVFLEKPLAMTSEEGARVVSTAAEAGVPLQIGLVLRFDMQHALLKARITAGDMGKLVSLRSKRNCSRSWFPDFGDRAHPMFETAIHDIDLLLWYTESPVVRVQAVERHYSTMRHPDGCWALLEFASGAVGIVETSWMVPAGAPANVVTPTWRGTIDAEIEVIGTEATGRIRLLDAPLAIWSEAFTAVPELGLWPEVDGAVAGALRAEDAHFLDRVRYGTPESTASAADALAGLRVAEAIVASAASRSPVDLEA